MQLRTQGNPAQRAARTLVRDASTRWTDQATRDHRLAEGMSMVQQLEQRAAAAGMSLAQLAKAAGLSTANVLYNLRAGRSSSLSPVNAAKVAAVLDADPRIYQGLQPIEISDDLIDQVRKTVESWTSDGSPAEDVLHRLRRSMAMPQEDEVRLEVRIQAEAGTWRRLGVIEHAARTVCPIVVARAEAARGLFAVEVGRGAERAYRPGTILFCIPAALDRGELQSGRRVVVRRNRGKQVEITVRELRRSEHGAELRCLGQGQETVPVPEPYRGRWTHGRDMWRIVGIVSAAYSKET